MNAVPIVSAIITPALLILACASLIGATAQRLTRVLDRTHRTAEEYERWSQPGQKVSFAEERRTMLMTQLRRAMKRSRILQRAMTTLYLSLSGLVGTSVAEGICTATGQLAWLPIPIGLIAVGLFFYATLVLIYESRLALASVHDEMDLVLQLSRRD
jgi:hypothetical protein